LRWVGTLRMSSVIILLSIVSGLTALMIVGPLSSYTWSEIMLKKALLNRGVLLDFWNKQFKDAGGVMGYLLAENPNWPKPKSENCRAVIRAEYETFRVLRRQAIVTFILFAALWSWVSLHYSYWILLCFLIGVPASAAAIRERGYYEALTTIFRSTRLWMWADPLSLKESAALQLVGVVPGLLREVETTEDPVED
jgi:hypothetical protein